MNSGVIRGGTNDGGEAAVLLDDGGKFTLNDGKVYGETWVVTVFNDTEFVMNGGSLETTGLNSIGVSGNGTSEETKPNYGGNAKITLNGGTITSQDLGVYAPQVNGETTIGEGMTINAVKCGVEVRAGTLNVNGATINVDEETPYEFNPNGSGSTATGVAIAVAQHTTKQEIVANVTGGTFTAPVAFAEGNPQHNADEDVAKIQLSITDGEFNATNGEPVVATEDVDAFISGGSFNKVPEGKYVASGYDVFADDERYIVDEAPVAYQGGDLFLQKGESEELDLGEIGNKYATLSLNGDPVATVEGRTVTATADGSSSIVIKYNNLAHPMSTTIGVAVYSVGTDDSDMIDEEDRDVVADFTAEQVKDLLDSGEESNNSLELYPKINPETDEIEKTGLEMLKDVLMNGDELFTSLDSVDFAEDLWDNQEGMDVINGQLEDGEEIAMVYGVDLNLCVGDQGMIGALTDLDGNEISFELETPEEYREAPEGYTREFSVLRFHGGSWDRLNATREGDVMKVSSDLFSTYVVAYKDTADRDDGENESGTGTDTDSETGTETETEGTATNTAGTPDTGTMTTTGASVVSAALVTAVVVGLLGTIVSFAYVIRRK